MTLDGYPSARDPVLPLHLRTSFLVDHDDKALAPLREAVRREAGDHPTTAQLEAFVARYIEKKNYARGHDIASVVARRREGDCTEHAVLLVALSRMFDIPARIVMGLAIVSVPDGAKAFGHEWAETYEEGHWRAADAVRSTQQMDFVRLPLSTMSDEGPGFAMSMIGSLGPFDVREVVLLAPPPQKH